jgi:hypothetical protein
VDPWVTGELGVERGGKQVVVDPAAYRDDPTVGRAAPDPRDVFVR